MLGVIAGGACAQADYLPTHGPTPFRFQVLPKPPVAVAEPVKIASEKPAEEPHPPQLPPGEPTELASKPVMLEFPPAPESVTVQSPAPFVTTPDLIFPSLPPSDNGETLTPHTLLQFFQSRGGASKSTETTVGGTVTFAPPRPAPKPASKATLESP